MPVTNSERIHMFTRRVLGSVGLSARLLDYLEDGIKRHTKAMTTGETANDDAGAWWAPVTIADGAGANHLDFGDMNGVDGKGNFISEESGSTYLDEVPFEDAATTYYMGASVALVPKAIAVNQSDGSGEYDYHELELAQNDTPSAVVDNGGSITLTLGNHLHASDDHTGRTAMVWLDNPESTSTATAIETVVITGQTITTTGVLGQTTVSTSTADYRVAILGPRITRTDISAETGLAFIGTVVGGGAPRVFTDSGQTIMTPLAEISNAFDELLTKGWIEVPGATLNPTNVTITSTGEAFTGGKLLNTATQAVTWAYTSSAVWITWNPATEMFEAYDDWGDANNSNRVPYLHFVVDGFGNSTGAGQLIARRVEEFNEPIVLQVSDTNVHRTPYRSLRAALARVWSLQQGGSPVKAIIEIIDTLTITSTLDHPSHFPHHVTFRGIGAYWSQPGFAAASGGDASQSRIDFSPDAPLFDIPDASNILGWTFEGIHFRYGGTSTDDENALIRALTNSPAESRGIDGVTFVSCVFDMNDLFGDAYPGVIHNLGTDSTSIGNIKFVRCIIYSEGALLWSTADVSTLHVIDCGGSQVGSTIPVGNPGGLIHITGDLNNCVIRGNALAQINAELLSVSSSCKDLYIHHNDFDFVPDNDVSMIEVGDWSGEVDNIRIDNNRMKMAYSGTSVEPLVHIKPDDPPSTPGLAGNDIWIINNTISGDDEGSATLVGILIETGGTADAECIFIQGNHISEVGIGIELLETAGSIQQVMITGNIIRAGSYGIDTNEAQQVVVANNIIEIDETNGIAVSSDGEELVVSGNIIETSGGTELSVELRSSSDYTVIMGNLASNGGLFDASVGVSRAVFIGNNGGISNGLDVAANDCVIVGNLGSTLDTGFNSDCVIVGNAFGGLFDIDITQGAIVGNHFDSASTNTLVMDQSTFVGNWVNGGVNLNDGGADDENTIVGNVFDGAISIDPDETVIVGNHFDTTFTIETSANETTIVGNKYAGGSFTDNGTNTYTSGNNTV